LPPPLTRFLEPGAHLARYLVAPGSRNHGSELPRDWGDLNAYKKKGNLHLSEEGSVAYLRDPSVVVEKIEGEFAANPRGKSHG
jgi:hypothetical protein